MDAMTGLRRNAWSMSAWLVAWLLLPAAGATEPGRALLHDGKPVSPRCVEILVSTLSIPAPAVDLDGCVPDKEWRSQWNGLFYDRPPEQGEEMGGGYFGYRHVGRTSAGLDVLLTWNSGGGSGVFTEMLLVETIRDRVANHGIEETCWRDRSQLVLRGELMGGDRCIGGIADARVDGADVIVAFYVAAQDVVDLATAVAQHGSAVPAPTFQGSATECMGIARYRFHPLRDDPLRFLEIDLGPGVPLVLEQMRDRARCANAVWEPSKAHLGLEELRELGRRIVGCRGSTRE